MVSNLPILLHVDNQAATRQLKGEASLLKANLVDIRVKFACVSTGRGIVLAQYVQSEQMLPDLLTKALDATKFAKLQVLMHVG